MGDMMPPSSIQYNSYCEIFHQFPVIEIQDNPRKKDYALIKSLAKIGDGDMISVLLHGWWRDERPVEGSIILGTFMVASPQTGVELFFARSEVEVRPGAATDPDYMARHISFLPMYIRAFGR
ncbi:unnamed protein product, partial [Tilletia controversa]